VFRENQVKKGKLLTAGKEQGRGRNRTILGTKKRCKEENNEERRK